jgi:O-6-methylguanine DNA methyltransferase
VTVAWTKLESPVGVLHLAATEDGLCRVEFAAGTDDFFAWLSGQAGVGPESSSNMLSDVSTQLREYFSGDRQWFDLVLDLKGTDFQRQVWRQLLSIPYGVTQTYGGIAQSMGRPPGAARAVGAAVGANPVPIIVPCHRVIGTNGSLVGFGGGLDVKVALLRLEGVLL